VQEGKHPFVAYGPPAAFYSRRGFQSAEEAFAAIAQHRKEREDTIKSHAALSYLFNGGLEYEKLKSYPAREIELIHLALKDIRDREEASINKARKK
jgi:hypothetical protein